METDKRTAPELWDALLTKGSPWPWERRGNAFYASFSDHRPGIDRHLPIVLSTASTIFAKEDADLIELLLERPRGVLVALRNIESLPIGDPGAARVIARTFLARERERLLEALNG